MTNAKLTRTLDPYMNRFASADYPRERGGRLTHDWLREHVAIDVPLRLEHRLKSYYLRHHGIEIRRRGDGWDLLEAREQIESLSREMKRSKRAIARGTARTGAVDPMTLTDRERELQDHSMGVAARISAALAGADKEIGLVLQGRGPGHHLLGAAGARAPVAGD